MGRHGENIRKRSDGRWEARMISGYDLNGKARYHSIYGKTYSEVKAKKNEWLRTVDYSKPAPISGLSLQKITVTQLLQEWLEFKKDTVKESTYAHYYRLIENHILPTFGNYYISALQADQINAFLKTKLHNGKLTDNSPLSPKTVSDIRSILMQGIAYARQQKYPCGIEGQIFYPRQVSTPIKVLPLEEQHSLERILYHNTTPYKLGLLLTLYCGLRIGELCALQWKDIHLDDGTILISKTLLRIQDTNPFSASKTKVIITQPKTLTSARTIPLPSFLIRLLAEYQASPECYLLSGTPKPTEPRSCLAKFKRLLRAAGLESYTFHTLRHTFATRCIENGFDVKSLSEILGHATINITLQRYVHPSMELKRSQMERLANLIAK